MNELLPFMNEPLPFMNEPLHFMNEPLHFVNEPYVNHTLIPGFREACACSISFGRYYTENGASVPSDYCSA